MSRVFIRLWEILNVQICATECILETKYLYNSLRINEVSVSERINFSY